MNREDVLRRIANAKVRMQLDDYLDSVVPGMFFDAPASFSGKHHAGESLWQHTCLVVVIADHLAHLHGISRRDRDMLIAAAVLHDTERGIDTGWTSTSPNHAGRAAERIRTWVNQACGRPGGRSRTASRSAGMMRQSRPALRALSRPAAMSARTRRGVTPSASAASVVERLGKACLRPEPDSLDRARLAVGELDRTKVGVVGVVGQVVTLRERRAVRDSDLHHDERTLPDIRIFLSLLDHPHEGFRLLLAARDPFHDFPRSRVCLLRRTIPVRHSLSTRNLVEFGAPCSADGQGRLL